MQVLKDYKVLVIRLRESVNATILPKSFEGHVFYFDGSKIMINCNDISSDIVNINLARFRNSKSVSSAGLIYKSSDEDWIKKEITGELFYV